jgi:hypothetical protein
MFNTQPWTDQYIEDEISKWFWGIQNTVELHMEPLILCVFYEDLPIVWNIYNV